MLFINTSTRTLSVDLGDGPRVVEPGQSTDVPERYAYVIEVRKYPLSPVEPTDAPEVPAVEPTGKKARK